MPDPAAIRLLISQNRLQEALELLRADYPEADALLRKLKAVEREKNLGTISFDEAQRALNQVAAAALDLLSQEPGQAASSEPPAAQKPSPHIAWIAGLVLLLGSTATLAFAFPCPTANVERAFNLLMALGAAGLATLLPGIFHLDIKGLKAGSALGVFALVFLFSPAGAVKDDSRCKKQPFEFTIALQADKNSMPSPNYPPLADAVLKIRLDNKWEPARVSADFDADYKALPGDFAGQKLAVQLQAQHWKLGQDSVALDGKSATLAIRPDGSLGQLRGQVLDAATGAPLPDVQIDMEGLAANTDASGRFSIDIPVEKQQLQQVLTARHPRYHTVTESVPIDGNSIQIRLKKQTRSKQ